MTKLELNDKLVELYDLEPFTMIGCDIPAIENSAIMFDLMIEHKIIPDFGVVYIGSVKHEYVTARQIRTYGSSYIVFLKDHESPQAAVRYAAAMALVKLAESKS